ncbi:hypothetical protein [Marinigracilibium pacificum]|uniref:Uncharacterized protein n=1 Tax=Marinigracilibium pacificum TaxID=2729599 RepID=A0A848J7K2_9BACT|nr:hypothetical protein [Marinigracilibium pacificum]NMM49082.1 hypothetical protein [Marinigracilibium pacificum]
MVLKYILINAGFILAGFLISYLINFAKWFNLSHPHDMGLSNLFLSSALFGIIGFAFTGYLFSDNKILLIISAIAIIALGVFLKWLF